MGKKERRWEIMQIRIEKQIGKSTLQFTVDGEKEIDALAKAAGFTTIPTTCTLCQSDDVILDANKAEGYTFVKVKCNKCNARSQMGQLRDGSGIFWKPFEKFIPKDNNGK